MLRIFAVLAAVLIGIAVRVEEDANWLIDGMPVETEERFTPSPPVTKTSVPVLYGTTSSTASGTWMTLSSTNPACVWTTNGTAATVATISGGH